MKANGLRPRTHCGNRKQAAWDGTSDKRFDLANSRFMVDTGQGDTVANQITVAANCVAHRWLNDGDVIDSSCMFGYPNDRVTSCANWLYKNGPRECRSILRDAVDALFKEEYSDLMYELCENCLNLDVLYDYADMPAVGNIFKCDGPFNAEEEEEEEDEYGYSYGMRHGSGKASRRMAAGPMRRRADQAGSKWLGLDYWDEQNVAGDKAWRDILDVVMDDVMEDAPYTSQADFDEAVKQSVYELFYRSVSFGGDFAENLESAFARDVEDALEFNSDNGGDDMSTYYGRGHESSRAAQRSRRF